MMMMMVLILQVLLLLRHYCVSVSVGVGVGGFEDVGPEAVAALAGELKGFRVAGVVVCCEGLGRRLQADQL